MRRPVPLRVKVALAGLAGVGLAWLIPKGGGEPLPEPTPTASDRPGVTAVEVPLDLIPEGVSVRDAGGIRVFLVRAEGDVTGLQIRSTAPKGGRVWWCPKNERFEGENGSDAYDDLGRPLYGSAPASMLRVRVLVAADRVTIFPHSVVLGPPPPPGASTPSPMPTRRCSEAERVG